MSLFTLRQFTRRQSSVNLRNGEHFQDQKNTTSESNIRNKKADGRPKFRSSDPTPTAPTTPRKPSVWPTGTTEVGISETHEYTNVISLDIRGGEETRDYDVNSWGYVAPEHLLRPRRPSSSRPTSQASYVSPESLLRKSVVRNEDDGGGGSYVTMTTTRPPPQDGDYVTMPTDDQHDYANLTPLVNQSLMLDTTLTPGELRRRLLQRSKGTYLLRRSDIEDDDVITLSLNTGNDVTDMSIHESVGQYSLDMNLFFLSVERLLAFYTTQLPVPRTSGVFLVLGFHGNDDLGDEVYSEPLVVGGGGSRRS